MHLVHIDFTHYGYSTPFRLTAKFMVKKQQFYPICLLSQLRYMIIFVTTDKMELYQKKKKKKLHSERNHYEV